MTRDEKQALLEALAVWRPASAYLCQRCGHEWEGRMTPPVPSLQVVVLEQGHLTDVALCPNIGSSEGQDEMNTTRSRTIRAFDQRRNSFGQLVGTITPVPIYQGKSWCTEVAYQPSYFADLKSARAFVERLAPVKWETESEWLR